LDIVIPTAFGVHVAQPMGVGGDRGTCVLLAFAMQDGTQASYGLFPATARDCANQMLQCASLAEQQVLRNVLKDVFDMATTLATLVEAGDLTAVPALAARIRERAEQPMTPPPTTGGPE
jgi:hypothetical protein